MKLSTLLLILSGFFFLPLAKSQKSENFKTVNPNYVISLLNLNLKPKFLDLQKAAMYRDTLGIKMMERLQMDYYIVQMKVQNGTISPRELEKMKKKLTTLHRQIQNFEISTNQILVERQNAINEKVLLFSKKKIKEYGAQEKAMIFSSEVVLYQNSNIPDITDDLMNYIYLSADYQNWVATFEEHEDLISKVEALHVEIEPIHSDREYNDLKKRKGF